MNLLDELIDIYLTSDPHQQAYYDLQQKEIVYDGSEIETGEPGIDWDEEGSEERYRHIPTISSDEAYRLMEKFAASVEDESKSEKLFDSLDRPKPFRRFKDTLFDLDLREQWYEFEHQYAKIQMEEWMKEGN